MSTTKKSAKAVKAAPTASLDEMFAAFGTPTTPAATATAAYPVIPGTPEVRKYVDEFTAADTAFKAAEARLKTAKAVLSDIAPETYFTANHGRNDDPRNVVAFGDLAEGAVANEAMVVFQSRYKNVEDRALIASVLGEDLTNKWIERRREITIDFNKIAEEKHAALVSAVREACVKLQIPTGDDTGVAVKTVFLPKAGFHTARHKELTAQQNVALHKVLPCVMYVKSRNKSGGKA